MPPSASHERVAAAVEAWFASQPDLPVEHDGDTWSTRFAGERKKSIPVSIAVTGRELVVQSFFMRGPDQNHAELYGYLLRRGARSYVLRFCLTDDGDVLLVAVLPHAAVTVDELDRLFGQLLAVADEAFDVALRLGFSSYIEREQRWREKVGAPRNPIS